MFRGMLGMEWKVSRGTMCVFNTFTRSDMRCSMEFPGGVSFSIVKKNSTTCVLIRIDEYIDASIV